MSRSSIILRHVERVGGWVVSLNPIFISERHVHDSSSTKWCVLLFSASYCASFRQEFSVLSGTDFFLPFKKLQQKETKYRTNLSTSGIEVDENDICFLLADTLGD
jgi:hypothetical protein